MSDNQAVMNDFDFHGKALDTIFDDYVEMLDSKPVGYSNKYGGFWYIAKSDDIFDAEQDPETWSVGPSMLLPSFGTDMPLIPIDIDPPTHAGFRKILLPMFTPMAVAKLEPGMHETAQSLADDVMNSTEEAVDVSALFARPMPTIIFSRLAGYPEEDWVLFDRWVDEIIYDRTTHPERAHAAGDELIAYMDKLINQRRNDPASYDDITNQLLTAKTDGRELTHEELLSYGYLLFLAGLDTTAWAIRAALWYLARNKDAQQKLRENPKLIPNATEEFLRTLSPVQAMARTALKDTVVRGQEIKQGERAVLVFGAGNRDPEVYEAPNDIDIERENNRHLAFGGGIHRCLGSNLGRKEVVISLEHFLATVPDFELAEDAPWHGVGPLKIKINKEH
ncbi:cytochrome P450 [Gulosibacter molinativorax]|uniref:Cytochrome P450 n=1 Tax=Gulosibacter molinativorax TaxID=256821 RepID=A0ABT7C491_9MICO|nr:cytochrome P450 [Gulosibacter molinativorax]MDJ1370039.1 cytochrome P450 [Gulosibacter molinativorax]QUY63770.1 Cytochrome P450 monooxygenase [Gulosibacter molinativorax]